MNSNTEGVIMNIEVIKEFLMQNWLVIVVALIILFFVLNVVKTVLKWLIAIIIIAALLIYSGISIDQIKQTVTDVQSRTMDTLKKEATSMMLKEASKATYVKGQDGAFTITSPNVEIKGRAQSDKVDVTFRGISLGEWKLDNETIRTFVEQAQENKTAPAS
ncbi:ATPase [Paenibacillus sp. 1781tsa1]|uniref:ATPase n=1 Tax=Paenibacillus sp. 1781tsa1 TaxID=2953810 RepID=UPI00209F3A46|nr:ATPase [Paenibacillus sp. 1781tsa1]MCP1186499.1 ATPase [Paenibacillus sp. 1781tsa1]